MKKVLVRRGIYRDSISLMQISTELSKLPGVYQAAVVMATELNRRVLAEAGFAGREVSQADSDGMVVAIEAKDQPSIDGALAAADKLLLEQGAVPAGQKRVSRSLDEAVQELPGANLAVISVPGRFARREASRALARGLNVFLFSSNVPIEDEVELKALAKERGLLMMGPDCGTSIINHKVLGFGNVVREGGIGLVSASGTGIQEVSTLIHKAGLGVSQAIGTGSSDMSEEVGGTTMLEGIRRLEADPKTEVIVLVSKPPAPKVAAKILRVVKGAKKPVVVNFLGADLDKDDLGGAIGATTLEDAAAAACAAAGQRPFGRRGITDELASAAKVEWSKLAPTQRYVRGLFAGGTLCFESQVILGRSVGDVYSNGPVQPRLKIDGQAPGKENTCVDMGAEEFVEGRLHPMIDFTLRNKRILKEASDPGVAVLLLDVELGYGSNPDPAGELAPSIRAAKTLAQEAGRFLSVVASIVATEGDSQDLKRQRATLEGAGALVAPSNASATELAALIASRGRGGRA